MIAKLKEKKQAIALRKGGLSYREILKKVPVAKSTLSLWLRSVGLSKQQKQRLTAKRLSAALRGGEKKREQRIARTEKIYQEAKRDITSISERDLWLMGIMLYWAEGSKEKESRPGSNINFSNSDPYMVKLFLKWLIDICNIKKERISFGIYIHENSKNRVRKVICHWARHTGFPKEMFKYIYFKKHNPKTKRENIGDNYFGNLKIGVRASSNLNRKIAGWIKAINQYYCGVV